MNLILFNILYYFQVASEMYNIYKNKIFLYALLKLCVCVLDQKG